MMTGRQTMLDQIAAGMADDEVEYLINRVGIQRVEEALERVKNVDDATARSREAMPATLKIEGVTYFRKSS